MTKFDPTYAPEGFIAIESDLCEGCDNQGSASCREKKYCLSYRRPDGKYALLKRLDNISKEDAGKALAALMEPTPGKLFKHISGDLFVAIMDGTLVSLKDGRRWSSSSAFGSSRRMFMYAGNDALIDALEKRIADKPPIANGQLYRKGEDTYIVAYVKGSYLLVNIKTGNLWSSDCTFGYIDNDFIYIGMAEGKVTCQ